MTSKYGNYIECENIEWIELRNNVKPILTLMRELLFLYFQQNYEPQITHNLLLIKNYQLTPIDFLIHHENIASKQFLGKHLKSTQCPYV